MFRPRALRTVAASRGDLLPGVHGDVYDTAALTEDNELTLAMTAGIGLGRLASVIHPYPTQAEAIRQTGDMYNRTRLTPTVRKLFAAWLRWTR